MNDGKRIYGHGQLQGPILPFSLSSQNHSSLPLFLPSKFGNWVIVFSFVIDINFETEYLCGRSLWTKISKQKKSKRQRKNGILGRARRRGLH
jgi:hypothetical protein